MFALLDICSPVVRKNQFERIFRAINIMNRLIDSIRSGILDNYLRSYMRARGSDAAVVLLGKNNVFALKVASMEVQEDGVFLRFEKADNVVDKESVSDIVHRSVSECGVSSENHTCSVCGEAVSGYSGEAGESTQMERGEDFLARSSLETIAEADEILI
jgi:hypothetical protein